MQQQLINYAEEIIDIFSAFRKEFRTHVIKKSCNSGLTVPQIMLMSKLHEHPGITLIELSKKLCLSKSTVSGIVDRLEKNGYIIKEIPENNRRTVKISMSPKGLENAFVVKNIMTSHLAEILETLELSEIEEIVSAFKKLEKLTKDKNNIDND